MARTIPNPPGHTWCDWCRMALAWDDAEITDDREFLCPSCWREWLAIIEKEA